MSNLVKKFSWRAKYILDGLRFYPRSLVDRDFWRIVLHSSDAYASLPFSPQQRLKPVFEKTLTYFWHRDGFFEFPVSYYGNTSFSLRILAEGTTKFDVVGSCFDLVFPYLADEAKAKIEPEVKNFLSHAFPGMLWEWNQSLFHTTYFYPKIHGTFWIFEGPYDNEKSAVREGDIVFDIGAHMGIFSCLAGLIVGERGRVYAFEPLKEYAEILRKNIVLNNLHNVVVVEKALGDTPSMVRMDGITITDKEGNIPVTTLDLFVRENGVERIDFFKMDVEGFERKVILGGMESLRKFKPRMGVCIYHLPDDPQVLKELILKISPDYHIELNDTGKKFIVF